MPLMLYIMGYLMWVYLIEEIFEHELPIWIVMSLAVFWPLYIILLTVNAIVYMIEFLIGKQE